MKKIVAVTACTTGIAHTYMAAKSLSKAAADMDVEIYVEKQGAAGVEDELTSEQIKEADVVIFAIEKGIDESRFAGKKIYKTKPGKAIKEGKKTIEEALEGKDIYIGESLNRSSAVKTGNTASKKKTGFSGAYTHMLAGISYMIPIVVTGGILIALSFAFGITAFEKEGSLPWALFQMGGGSAFALMFPVLAAFIAYDIADKPGFGPGIIGGYLAYTSGSGFVGAIIAGYLAGYLARYINKNLKVPEFLQGLKPIVIIPVVTTLVVGLVILYVVKVPIIYLQDMVSAFLNSLADNNTGAIVLGRAFGCLYFDLGGPVSKMVYSFAIAAYTTGIYTPMGAAMVCGMVPPIGMAIATFLKPKLFSEDEREAGKTALILGFSFITEGAIPFLISKPKASIIANAAGSSVGSIVAFLLKLEIKAPHGGMFLAVIPNAVSSVLGLLVAVLAGSLVTALIMVVILKFEDRKKLVIE